MEPLRERLSRAFPGIEFFLEENAGDGIRYFAVVLMAGTLWPMTFGWFSLMGRKK